MVKKSIEATDPDSQLWSKFQFDMPIHLVKGEETEKGWKIKGLASTEDRDLQGEIVKQRGLDISPIKQGQGWINYNHSSDPEDMVGKLDDASMTQKGLFVEGYLFKKHKRAQSIFQILKSLDDKDSRAVKLSIEGKILKRSGKNNKVVSAAKVDKVAITFDPINTSTYVELCKAISKRKGEEDMEKAYEAQETDIHKENDILSPGDQKRDANPANEAAAGGEAQEDLGNGLSSPDPDWSGQQKPKEPNVYELLERIETQLSVLVAAQMIDQKEKTVKAFKDLVSSKINSL